jgi:hypothetical protein
MFKLKIVLFTLFFISLSQIAYAQNVNINDVDATDAEETTISIRKGKTPQAQAATVVAAGKCEPVYEISEGTEEVTGEGNLMNKPAKQNWTKACEEWKKSFRADNKANQIISISCGRAACANENNEVVCTSTATYKVKVKLSE